MIQGIGELEMAIGVQCRTCGVPVHPSSGCSSKQCPRPPSTALPWSISVDPPRSAHGAVNSARGTSADGAPGQGGCPMAGEFRTAHAEMRVPRGGVGCRLFEFSAG